MDDTQRLKRYLAEEMVEEYEEGRMSRRRMIVTVGRILGVTVVSPLCLQLSAAPARSPTSRNRRRRPCPRVPPKASRSNPTTPTSR